MSGRGTDWKRAADIFRPGNARQWILAVVFAPLIVLLLLGLFLAPFFVPPVTGPSSTWDGGSLLIVARSRDGVSCQIRPDTGRSRTVQVEDPSGRGSDEGQGEKLQPWFSGQATVACSGKVQTWTGWKAEYIATVGSFGGWIIIAVAIGVMVVVYVIAGSNSSRAKGSTGRRVRSEDT